MTYSLTDDAGGLFAINSNSGVVSVNASLDYETSQQHTITVQALSTDQSTQSSDFTVQIINATADDGLPRVNLVDYGYDETLDQKFIELTALGSFDGSSGVLIGFENPEVLSPENGTGMSSVLNSLMLRPDQSTDKFYFDKNIETSLQKVRFGWVKVVQLRFLEMSSRNFLILKK